MERFASYLRLQSYNVVELGFEPYLLGSRDHARNHGMFSVSPFPILVHSPWQVLLLPSPKLYILQEMMSKSIIQMRNFSHRKHTYMNAI